MREDGNQHKTLGNLLQLVGSQKVYPEFFDVKHTEMALLKLYLYIFSLTLSLAHLFLLVYCNRLL